MAIWRIPLRAGAEGESAKARISQAKGQNPERTRIGLFFCRPIFLFRLLEYVGVKEWGRRGEGIFFSFPSPRVGSKT